MLQGMQGAARQLIKSLHELCWLSRGYLQYHDALYLTAVERQIMSETIEERMNIEKEKPFPQY